MEELRLVALEDRLAADLDLGRARESVAELESLVHEHPLRERFWQLLVLALYRADRQADALAAYSRARDVLDEELGVEPSPDLRRLQIQVLEQDSALQAPGPHADTSRRACSATRPVCRARLRVGDVAGRLAASERSGTTGHSRSSRPPRRGGDPARSAVRR